jgi:hypothetical protein
MLFSASIVDQGDQVTESVSPSSIDLDGNLDRGLRLGMLLIDLLETTLDLQEDGSRIVSLSTTEADLTRHVTHNQVVPLTSVDILHQASLKIPTSTNVAQWLAHCGLLRVQGSSNLGGFGI